jgi:sugar phosphate isomerase/epimerase
MHPRISVNNICFMLEPLATQLAYWPQLNVRRVSVLGPQLDGDGKTLVQQAITAGNLQLETVVHPFSSAHALDSPEEVLMEARERLSKRISEAREVGAKSIYMTTGGHGGLTWEQAAAAFADAIAPCVTQAKSAGIALMIENAPPQYADLHIAHTLRDSITLAEMAGIGVCIDVIGCWTEAGLNTLIAQALPRCHLVQVSDYVLGDRTLPSRAVPGDGNLPLKRVLGSILDAGYTGVFDLELLGPRINQEGAFTAVRRAVDSLGELLHALGA